ncbi:MAG: LysM peptidoglycan-binding domain-containing protein [Pseudomonadota bacterium]
MQPATRNLLVIAAIAAVGVAGWTFLGDADRSETNPKDAAVVQQPSGEVLTETDEGAAGARQNAGQDTDQGSEQSAAASGTRIGVLDQGEAAGGGTEGDGSEGEQETAEGANRGVDLQIAALPLGDDKDVAQGDQASDTGTGDDTQAGTDQASEGAEEDDPSTPRFDVVRVDQDGQAVLAGRAEPGSRVEIVLDGTVIAEVQADGSGQFATFVDVDLGDTAQSLELRVPVAKADDADTTASAGGGADAQSETPDDASAEQTLAAADPSTDDEPSVAAAASRLADPSAGGATPSVSASDSAPASGTAPAQGAEPQDDQRQGSEAAATVTDAQGGAVRVEATTRVEETVEAPTTTDATPAATARAAKEDPAPSETDDPTAQSEQSDLAALTEDDAPLPPDEVEGSAYRVSAPVIILPAEETGSVPTLIQPQEQRLALLQPSTAAVNGVVLDQITYSDVGDVRLWGRARPGRAVRVYGNGQTIDTVKTGQDGSWTLAMPAARGRAIKLFRLDELEANGSVSSRIETPFEYEQLSPKVVRERRVVIQRGDMLWRIAEQFYGEGLRYSVIYGANEAQIRDPDLIYPGQVFSIPELVDAN